MKTAAWPREQSEAERLLVVDPAAGRMADFAVRDLPSRLRPGDLLVANEGGALTIAVRCAATCTTHYLADGPPTAHVEGHLVFAPH